MTRDLYIQDTADVFFTSLVTGNVVGVGYAQMAGLDQTEESEDIRGGIGNKLAYTIRSSKDLELSVTSATFKPEFFELTQGTEYKKDVEAEVTQGVTLKVGADGAVSLPEDMEDVKVVRIEDLNGNQEDVEFTDGEGELPDTFTAKEGDELEAYYLKTIVGRALEFDAEKFGSKVRVDYNTICYDREKAVVYSDLHFVFPECIPAGDFSMSLSAGEAYIPEMTFKVTAPKDSSVLGTKYEVVRDAFKETPDTPDEKSGIGYDAIGAFEIG